MANGRLGSALIPAKRTTVVYDNTSGGSAAISVMAKMRSSTSNSAISIVLDSSNTLAETSIQVDSSSYTGEALKLFYNSGVTATTGKLEFDNYSASNKSLRITDFSDSSVTNSDDTMHVNPQWTSTDYSDWGCKASHIPILFGNTSQPYVYFTTLATQTAFGGMAFSKRLISSSATAPSAAFLGSTSASYGGYRGATDLYCDRVPTFLTGTTAGYMSAIYLHTNGTQADTASYATNSLYRAYYDSGNPGNNNDLNRYIFASGGIALFSHRDIGKTHIVCYGRTGAPGGRISSVISNNVSSFGANYAYHYHTTHGNLYSQTGIFNINFFEYNPNTGKSYALMYWGDKRRLLEFDVDAWEAKLANDDGQTGGNSQTFDATVSAGLVTDISSLAPSNMLQDNTLMGGPVVRTAKSNWLIPINSGGTHTIYQTSDFRSYSIYDTTSNYSELITDDVSVASNGSVTNALTNNLEALDKGGTVEYQTSFNQLERTGLVISNNDRVVVRNNGDSDLAVQVMGYEE